VRIESARVGANVNASVKANASASASFWYVLALALLSIAAMVTATWLSRGDTSAQLVATFIITAVGFLLIWCTFTRDLDHLSIGTVLIVLTATRFVALFAQPLLEDDHFRYLWDGFISASTGRPFLHAPAYYFADANVPVVMRETLNGINNPEIPTLYGPVLQVIFALCYWVAPAELWPQKIVLLCAELAIIFFLRASGVSARWLLIFILHPLVLKESAITAHPDVLIGAALLAAVAAWGRGKEACAASLVCVAVAMKMSALVALPFFLITQAGRFSVRGLVAVLATILVCYAPLIFTYAGAETRALAVFGEQWTFNPLLFRLISLLTNDTAARMVAAIIFVGIAIFISVRWVMVLRRTQRHSMQSSPPLLAIMFAMLLLSPVVNPWYWLWVLPLVMLQIEQTKFFACITFVATSVSLLAYSHVVAQVTSQSAITSYAVPAWATAIQLIAVVLAVLYAMQLSRKKPPHRSDHTIYKDA
jgi:alpha-1,6-mannosyltransferase